MERSHNTIDQTPYPKLSTLYFGEMEAIPNSEKIEINGIDSSTIFAQTQSKFAFMISSGERSGELYNFLKNYVEYKNIQFSFMNTEGTEKKSYSLTIIIPEIDKGFVCKFNL